MMDFKQSLFTTWFIGCVFVLTGPANFVRGLDLVTIRDATGEKTIEGRVEIEAQDGGLLLLGRDGKLWTMQKDQIVSHQANANPFVPHDRETMAEGLLKELPSGFKVRHTEHYVIAYNTTDAYAIWCSKLYERLFVGFQRYFRERKWDLDDPLFPLTVILFEDRMGYQAYGKEAVGDAISSVVGYYSLETNRIATYDLTGLEQVRQPGSRPATTVLINQALSVPAGELNVATMMHEATHQLAYNLGVQSRTGFNPLWLSEGLAIFFETPDLRNSKGWGKIGLIHYPRLQRFRQALAQGNAPRLASLLSSDDLLREPQTAVDSYAASWSLCFYLLKRHPQEMMAYMRELAELPAVEPPSPEERIELFKKHFGAIDKFEKRFVEYIVRLN